MKWRSHISIGKAIADRLELPPVELKAFLDCVRAKKSFPVTPQEAQKNLQICERIKRDLHIGAP